MGIDRKYGQVTTENGDIGEDEPVFLFRAQDRLLPELLTRYLQLCYNAGSPQHHLDSIHESRNAIITWQERNNTKVPTSDSLVPKE